MHITISNFCTRVFTKMHIKIVIFYTKWTLKQEFFLPNAHNKQQFLHQYVHEIHIKILNFYTKCTLKIVIFIPNAHKNSFFELGCSQIHIKIVIFDAKCTLNIVNFDTNCPMKIAIVHKGVHEMHNKYTFFVQNAYKNCYF